MADINVTEEIIDINVTEEVVNIIAPSGGYPLPNTINSVFGRVGNIVATEGDYTLTQLGDVTLTSPNNGQVLKYNGTQWVNSTDADTGITTLNTLTALSQTFATGSSGTDFNISSATSTHTFNFPTASATNRGLLSSVDWTTFNLKQNALTDPVTGTGTTNTLPKFTGASTIGNSNISDSGTLVTIGTALTLSGSVTGVGNTSNYNVTASAGSAISKKITSTLVASANGDSLYGLDINSTYTTGAFTGVTTADLRLNTRLFFQSSNWTLGDNNSSINHNAGLKISSITAGSHISFRGVGFTTYMQMFNNTGNFILQNGGSFTDAGFRLDVNGTTRFIGTASTDSPPLGSELLTTSNWTSTGWTGDFTTGFTHTTGNTSVLSNTLAAVIGTYYKIQITRSGGTTGSITIGFGGVTRSVSNTRSFEPLATTTGNLTITPTSDFDGTILISVRTIGLASPSVTISPSTGTGQITMRATNVGNNTIIGLEAGQRLSSSGVGDDGAYHTFFGYRAGRNSTQSRYNTFIGTSAGELNSIGSDNTAIGRLALNLNTIGGENTALGTNAGQNNTTGNANTFIGRAAGLNNTTGSLNVIIGNNAGSFITGGVTANTISNNSIFIGQNTRAAADNQTNQIVIGYQTTGLGSNTTIIGNSSTTQTSLYGSLTLGTTSTTASALLSMSSTTQGFLPPVMTTTQKNAISSPATGLIVFDTTLAKLCVYTGAAWQTITSV